LGAILDAIYYELRTSLRALRGGGYEFNPPKTKAGRRTITPAMFDALKARLLPPASLSALKGVSKARDRLGVSVQEADEGGRFHIALSPIPDNA